jgi:hypothetical protein
MDWKSMAGKGLDVVVGVASAAVGVTGGPEAAKGVQMAGGGIKGIVEEATGGEKPSRKERLERADFGAREKPRTVTPPSDEENARNALIALGYSGGEVERILEGRPQRMAASTPTQEKPVVQEEPTASTEPGGFDAKAIIGSLGRLIKGESGKVTVAQPGSMDGALPADDGKRVRNG